MKPDIRRPVHRGSQLVRALWFDCALLGEAEARRRLLAQWDNGARAWRLHGAYLLEWRQARRLQCEHAPGLPFCDQDGLLASAPLLPAERAGVAPGAVILVLGASLHVQTLDAALRVDPSAWLDLSCVPVSVPLAMPAQAAAGFVAGVPAAAPDVRAILGDAVPPASPQRAAFLRQASEARHASGATPSAAGLRLLGGVLATAFIATGGLAAGLLVLLRAVMPNGEGGASSAQRGAAGDASAFWRDRLARLAMLTGVSKLLGWRQANYLRKMLRQFEQGDLGEALRHAIPLDNPGADAGPAFGTPGRRGALDISGPNASATGIGMDPGLVAFLRTTYRRSFEQLDRAGRIDEAVYVLAELLHRHQEAVDYLERKDRIAQAAQLAETLELDTAVIVRLHCMAGNVERAVLLARLRNGFVGAVAELERRHHPAAAGLRLAWAQALAARGDLVEAASAVWPLQDERERARGWLHAAEQAGGTLGVQGLVYRLALDPDTRQGTGVAVQDLLYAADDAAVRQRVRACDCLLKLDTHNPATRRLAAELWRRLLADRAAGRNAVPHALLQKLLKLAADPVLAEDAPAGLPSLPDPQSLQQRSEPVHLRFGERGLLPLEDVRRLPDGAWLLALGEAGVALARADGTELVRFPVPAHHLVLADNGRHALVLARREKAMRVSRIDLLQRTSSDWFSASLDFWAGAYDGTSWNVVADERLMALDTGAAGQSVLWQVRDLPGRIVGFDQWDDMQALLMNAGGVLEQWRYTLPQRRLLGRYDHPIDGSVHAALPDCDNALPVLVRFHPGDEGAGSAVLGLDVNGGTVEHRIALRWIGKTPRVSLHGNLTLLHFEREDGAHCQLLDHACRVLADVVLPDALGAGAMLQDGHLVAWDRRGRVLELDIASGGVRMVTFG